MINKRKTAVDEPREQDTEFEMNGGFETAVGKPHKKDTEFKKTIPWGSVIVFGFVGVLMVLVAISYIYIIFWAVMSSLKDTITYVLDPFGLPKEFFFENFTNAWYDLIVEVWISKTSTMLYFSYGRMFMYSVIMTVVGSFMAVFMPMLTGYIVARYRFWGRDTLYRIGIFVMIIPLYGTLASSLLIDRKLGIYDNLVPFLLTATGPFGFNFVLLYGAFKGLSNAYAEAAEIDGAGHQTIMWRLYVPMMLPTLIALFIMAFIGHWNDYMTVLTYLPSTPNLAYGVYLFNQLSTAKQYPESEVLAAYILVAIPTIIVWLMSQKLVVGKIIVGGLKG